MRCKSANEVNKPKKPVGPKIITTIFLAADNIAAAKNNVGIIFGLVSKLRFQQTHNQGLR